VTENQLAGPAYVGSAPWIACTDLRDTVDYYRNVLGFRGDWHWFWGEPPDHAGVSRESVRILLFESPEKSTRYRDTEIVVYVRNVRQAFVEHRDAGARIVREPGERPWGTVDYTVEDPNGYRLIFTEAPDEL
jgi:catechol 2,3-dioxygenase-like lactoylglutathione lyase family enzyme